MSEMQFLHPTVSDLIFCPKGKVRSIISYVLKLFSSTGKLSSEDVSSACEQVILLFPSLNLVSSTAYEQLYYRGCHAYCLELVDKRLKKAVR